MGIKLYSLGAAEEVTGSKHIFEIDGRTFMVDCGAFQGKRKTADEKNRNFSIAADKVEAVILTHGHLTTADSFPYSCERDLPATSMRRRQLAT